MIQNYIFDFYGTLVDIHTDETKEDLWKSLIQIYEQYHVHYSLLEIQKQYTLECQKEIRHIQFQTNYKYPEIDLLHVFTNLFQKEGNTFQHQTTDTKQRIVEEIATEFRTRSRDFIHLFPNTVTTLETLKRKGNSIYLLSNAQHCFTMNEIEMVGLLDYFDGIYLSSDYQMKKPQKEFLELCLQENHLNKQESIMIGNEIESDIQVAMNCSIRSILLNSDHREKKEIENKLKEFKQNPFIPTIINSGNILEILEVKQ